MIVPEYEAKELWCPLTKTEKDSCCIGSRCMMWRAIEDDSDLDKGYCGLAGKP